MRRRRKPAAVRSGYFLAQFNEGELRRPIDGDNEMELALSGSDLGDVDMK